MRCQDIKNHQRRTLCDTRRHRLENCRNGLQPITHHTKRAAHHRSREGAIRDDALGETARKDGTHHIEQDGMGQKSEQGDDQQGNDKLEPHEAQCHPLAILRGIIAQQATLPTAAIRHAAKDDPHQYRRRHIVLEPSEKPADALCAQK